MSGTQDPRHAAGRDLGAADLWDRLDEWEPDPISLDFNRRLHQRVESVDRRRVISRAFPLGPAIVLFALMILYSSSTRPVNSTSWENSFLDENTPSRSVEPETASMVQTLYDLDMLQTLNSEQSL